MRYEIDTERFYEYLSEEYEQCTALERSFAAEGNWAKAAEYAEDASVYSVLLDAFLPHNAGKHDWLIPKRETVEVVWHDLRKDINDRPKQAGMMAVVIESARGLVQIYWHAADLPEGAIKWCSIPNGVESYD